MAETVAFFGPGQARLTADLYPARKVAASTTPPGPAIVFGLGFGSVRSQVQRWGERLSGDGYTVIVPDYRGFGDSEGQAGRIAPLDQVEDLRAALTYLTTIPGVDDSRIFALGVSTGGANSIYLAGVDDRVRAVASIVGWANGERHLRDMRRHYEWLEFKAQIEANRRRRVLEGKEEGIDPDLILIRDPEAAEWRRQMIERFPDMRFTTTWESAERIMEFQPERVLPYPRQTPLLLVHAEQDALVPVDQAQALYERASEPKLLVVLPGISHHAVHEGEAFERCIALVTDWFRQAGESASAGPRKPDGYGS